MIEAFHFYHSRKALLAQLEVAKPLWASLARIPALELASMLRNALRLQRTWLYDLVKKLEQKTGGRDGTDAVDWHIDREYKLALGATVAMVAPLSGFPTVYDQGPMTEFAREEGGEIAGAEEMRKGGVEKAIPVVDLTAWEWKQKQKASARARSAQCWGPEDCAEE